MLNYFIQRAHVFQTEKPSDLDPMLSVTLEEKDTSLKQVLERLSYQPIRYGFDMVRDLTQPIPELALPTEIEIRPATPDQYRAIWDADVEAFRDHWGFTEPDEAEFVSWKHKPHFQPHLWKIAWQGDQVVAQVQNFILEEENQAYNVRCGYTEGISTRRPWRKQGIASALIAESMRMLKNMGMTGAKLGVDALNPNGALQVYEQLGFKALFKATTYRRPLEL